jgi:cobalamin biosynthesis Mg chelatase CobN
MTSLRGLFRRRCSRDQLSCYLDGQLSERQAARVEKHLNECTDCREELDSLRATVDLLGCVTPPCMPRPVVIPEAAIEAQSRTRRLDTTFATLRVGAVAVTLVLAVLLSQDAISTLRSRESTQTVAMEMASGSGPATEAAGGGPGVLREAPVEREAIPEAVPAPTSDVEQVDAPPASKQAESATDTAAENATTPEVVSVMAAPLGGGVALEGEVTEEAAALAMQSPLDAQADGPAELSAASESASAKIAVVERPTSWTPSRIAAAILAALLVALLGALLWIGRRRVTL